MRNVYNQTQTRWNSPGFGFHYKLKAQARFVEVHEPLSEAGLSFKQPWAKFQANLGQVLSKFGINFRWVRDDLWF